MQLGHRGEAVGRTLQLLDKFLVLAALPAQVLKDGFRLEGNKTKTNKQHAMEPTSPRTSTEWQYLSLAQEDFLELRKALDEKTDPTDTLKGLGVAHYHKPYFKTRIPIGGSDATHSSEIVLDDDIPSILDYAKKMAKQAPNAYQEVMQQSRSETAPLLGNLKKVRLGTMHQIQSYFQSERDDGNTSTSPSKSTTAPPFAQLGLSVHDRPYCETGPKLGLLDTDIDLTSGFVLVSIQRIFLPRPCYCLSKIIRFLLVVVHDDFTISIRAIPVVGIIFLLQTVKKR